MSTNPQNERITCKGCNQPFVLLLAHLKKKKECQIAYGEEYGRLLKLQSEKILDRQRTARKNQSEEKTAQIKAKRADYYEKNKASLSQKRKEQRKNQSEEKTAETKAQRSDYRAKNKASLRQKNADWQSQNKAERTLKRNKLRNENPDATNKNQKEYRGKRLMNMTAKDRFMSFKKEIIDGPNFACLSCKRSLFKNSIRILKSTDVPKLFAKLDKKFKQRINLKAKRLGDDVILCHNCLKLIRCGKVPKIHVSNGLWLDKVPEELELTDLEQQLIAPCLLFMKVKKLPTTRMKAMVDKVISVPIEQDDVSKTISKLPRHPNEAKIVAVQLKRKLEMRNTHLEEFVRPAKCIKGVEKLKELKNPFFQNVQVNDNFMDKEEVC